MDGVGFVIIGMVGFWSGIIGLARVFLGYEFVDNLILANIGFITVGITYLAFSRWFKRND